MTKAHDIEYVVGAVHDDLGAITSILPVSEAGRKWLASVWGETQGEAYIIETYLVDIVCQSAEVAGLRMVSI